MNKEQRLRKRKYHEAWQKLRPVETYPVWLEGELEAAVNRTMVLQEGWWKSDQRVNMAKYYVQDLEKGLRIIRRSLDTLKVSDGEVVFKAVSWLERTVDVAKREFENGKR